MLGGGVGSGDSREADERRGPGWGQGAAGARG